MKNLTAFAKVYGHVKYFHPSDEAREIDWDKLAIHGAGLVKEVESDEELKRTLESLFLPVAPTVRFHTTEPVNRDFLPEYLQHIGRSASELQAVAWQHQGVDMEFKFQHRYSYSSNRIHRQDRARDSYFLLYQILDVENLSGHPVRFHAMIRSDVAGEENEGQLYLRMDDEHGRPLVIETVPVSNSTSEEWNLYEIRTDTDPRAAWITAGVKLKGEGELWVDDLSWSKARGTGEWVSLPLNNPLFEDQFQEWNRAYRGTYNFYTDPDNAFKGTNSVYITNREPDIPDFLFGKYPEVGETVIQRISEGLWSEVPIALYSDEAHTLPITSQEDLRRLGNELESIDLNFATGNDEDTRLANIIIAWNVLHHFYPYFDVVDTDWEQQLIRSIREALSDQTAADFYKTLSRLIAPLHDGHGWVIHPSTENRFGFPFIVDWIENEVVVTHSEHEKIQPGDIIQAVDGIPAFEIIEANIELTSGSPQYRHFLALQQFALGKNGTESQITVLREDELQDFEVTRSVAYDYFRTGRNLPVIGELGDDILYVDLDRVLENEFIEMMGEISAAEKVIFDLRGYPADNITLILNHLMHEPDTSDQWMQTPQIIYPDQVNVAGFRKSGWNLQPESPTIQGKVAFITDGRAISYAESLLSFVEHYELAEIVGQPTAGANGGVNSITLPGQYQISWTGMKVVKHDGSQHHLVGIQPTVPVEKTIHAVREGKDEFLEKAIEILQ